MAQSQLLFPCLLLIVLLSPGVRSQGQSRSIAFQNPEQPTHGLCEDITIPICKDNIGYNQTFMPNMLGHETQDDAGLEATTYHPLVKINCSPQLKLFLCTLYLPVCTILTEPVPPCRSVCIAARDGCIGIMRRFGHEWPVHMACEKFPDPPSLCVGPDRAQPGSNPVAKVYGTQELAPYDGPREFGVVDQTHECVNLTWIEPEYPNGIITDYNFTCSNGSDIVSNSSSTLQGLLCGFYPGSNLTCNISAHNSAGYSPNATTEGRLDCTTPETPVIDSPPSESVISVDNRDRIQLTYTWPPVETNCYNNVTYYLTLTDVGDNTIVREETTQDNSATFTNLDPFRNYSLLLVAGNDAGINSTDNKAKVYKTQELAPYDGPREFGVVDHTHDCVYLTWIEPEYPNGIITDYNFTCSNGSDIVSNSSCTLQGLLCGFYPGSYLTCNISAHNSAGYSPNATTEGRLDCTTHDTPVIDSPPSESVISVDSRDRIQLTYSWPAVDRPCHGDITYKVTLRKPSHDTMIYTNTTQEETITFIDLDAVTEYSLVVVAVNSEELNSTSPALMYTTQELAPYDGPGNFIITKQDNWNIRLTWTPPEHPNSVRISSYTYQCTQEETNGTIEKTDATENPLAIVGQFKPEYEIVCHIFATNDEGNSPSARRYFFLTSSDNLPTNGPEGDNSAAIAGGVVGSVALIIISAVIIAAVIVKKRRTTEKKSDEEVELNAIDSDYETPTEGTNSPEYETPTDRPANEAQSVSAYAYQRLQIVQAMKLS